MITLLIFFYVGKNYNNTKKIKSTPNHSSLIKPPTYKFQKYLPKYCSHERGIYRNFKIKILDKSIEKSIFVCADCLSVFEKEEK
jgi:hypothetical protein